MRKLFCFLENWDRHQPYVFFSYFFWLLFKKYYVLLSLWILWTSINMQCTDVYTKLSTKSKYNLNVLLQSFPTWFCSKVIILYNSWIICTIVLACRKCKAYHTINVIFHKLKQNFKALTLETWRKLLKASSFIFWEENHHKLQMKNPSKSWRILFLGSSRTWQNFMHSSSDGRENYTLSIILKYFTPIPQCWWTILVVGIFGFYI